MFDHTSAQALETSFDTYTFAQLPESSRKALALEFMTRLARDDDFREALVRNPVATAAHFGFAIDPNKLPQQQIRLPEKAVIAQYLEVLAARFSAQPSIIIVFGL